MRTLLDKICHRIDLAQLRLDTGGPSAPDATWKGPNTMGFTPVSQFFGELDEIILLNKASKKAEKLPDEPDYVEVAV